MRYRPIIGLMLLGAAIVLSLGIAHFAAINAQSILPFGGLTAQVSSIAFSQDGKILASLGQDKMVILWDALERNPITRIDTHHNGPPTVIGFSPDGKLL